MGRSEQRRAARMGEGKRRLLTILFAYPLVLMGLTLVIANFAINSPVARGFILEQVNSAIPGTIAYDRILLTLPPLKARIYGVRISHPQTGRALIKAREVHATLVSGLMELPDRVALGDVRLVGGEVELNFDAAGNLDLVEMFAAPGPREEKPKEPSQLQFSLEGIQAEELRFVLRRPEIAIDVWDAGLSGGAFALDRGEMRIDAGLTVPRGRVQLLVGGTEGQPLLDIPVNDLRVDDFRWRGQGFSLGALSLRSRGAEVRGCGAMWLGEQPSFTGTTDLRLAFDDSFLDPLVGEVLGGAVRLQGHFHGPMDEAHGSFVVSSSELQVPQLRLTDLDGQMHLAGQQVNVEQLTLGLLGGRASVEGMLRILDGVVRAKAALDKVRPDPFLPRGTARDLVAGEISGDASVSGTIWGPPPMEVDAELDVRLLRSSRALPLPRRWSLKARTETRGTRHRVKRLDLSGGGHRLRLNGWVDPARQDFDASLRLGTANLVSVLQGFGVRGVSGRADLKGRARGTFLDPGFEGELVISEGFAQGYSIPHAEASVRLEHGQATLRQLKGRGAWGSVQASGGATLWRGSTEHILTQPPFHLALQGDKLQLGVLVPRQAGFPITGLVDLKLEADGTPRDLEAEVDLTARELTLRALEVKSLSLKGGGRLVRGRAGGTVERLLVELGGGGTLEASGTLKPDQTFLAALKAKDLPIVELEKVAGVSSGATGTVGLELTGRGPLLEPLLDGKLSLKELVIAPPSKASEQAEEDDDDEGEEEGDEEEDAPFRYSLGDATIKLGLGEDQVLHVGSRKAFGWYDLDVSLPLDLDGPEPALLSKAEVVLAFERLVLEEVVPGLQDKEVAGVVSGRIQARLPRGPDKPPEVELELGELSLNLMGQELSNPRDEAGVLVPLRLAFDGQRFQILRMELESAGKVTALSGGITLNLEDVQRSELELSARGTFDVGVLRPLVPMLPRLGGELLFQLAVGGTLRAPRPRGQLAVNGLSFQVEALGRELALERGTIFFSEGRVSIPASHALTGRFGRQGAFSIQSEVSLPSRFPLEIPRARVVFQGERLRLALPEQGLNLTVDVPLVEVVGTDLLSAEDRRIDIGGEVRLASGRLIKGFTDPEALATAIRGWFEGLEEAQGSSLPPDHPVRALRFRNFKVSGEEGAFLVQVQAAILSVKLHVRPELVLTNGIESLSITGTVETQDEDTITLVDREFSITRNEIQFDGSTKPIVDIEAETVVIAAALDSEDDDELAFDSSSEEERTYHITLYLKGRLPDDLEKFELGSPQTMDQRDLWTLLLLGYRYSDLDQASRKGDLGGEVLLSSALQILSQKITEEALKKFQLVDQLTLLSQRQDVKVQVSKKVLGGKLELLGSGTFSGAESEQSLGAKLYLKDRVFLEFSTTPGADHSPMSGRLGWQVPLD